LPFVLVPSQATLLVGIQHLLCGGKERNMFILDVADPVKEVGEVLFLGKSGKLRYIVESNVDNPGDICGAQRLEELGCRLLCKPDCIESHHTASPTAGMLGVTWAMRAS